MAGERAEYKSAIRSKRLIREAYIELLKEKPLEKVTVTDIVKRADINRGTFYAHYADTRAVLEQIENEIIDRMKDFLSGFNYRNFFQNPLPTLLKVVRFLEENKPYREFLESTGNAEPFLARARQIFTDYLKSDLQIPDEVKNSLEFKTSTLFISGGIINVYRAWFQGETDQSPEELSITLAKLITGNRSDTMIGN